MFAYEIREKFCVDPNEFEVVINGHRLVTSMTLYFHRVIDKFFYGYSCYPYETEYSLEETLDDANRTIAMIREDFDSDEITDNTDKYKEFLKI